MQHDIDIIFVLPATCISTDPLPSEISEVMAQAFKCCKQHVRHVSWQNASEILQRDLSKTDFLIFQEFKGELFEELQKQSTMILGPWCVWICLTTGRSIPNYPWPIYNVALIDCKVTCSHMSNESKARIRELVHRMGASYTDELSSKSTHLISDSVKSEKYSKAVESGLKIMLPEWIDVVWKTSQNNNAHGDDTQFKQYRCPIFHKLIICSTGLTKVTERNDLKSFVVNNGGTFAGSLDLRQTDILVVSGLAGKNSAKFKAARQTAHIQCVTIDWIKDSVQKGSVQPYEAYKIKHMTSTPEKDCLDPNFSIMSAISVSAVQKSSIDDTLMDASHMSKTNQPKKRKGSLFNELGNLIDGLDIKTAKSAGLFLDGCSIYIAGFEGEHKEKLIRIINLSGAIQYEDVSERITHVIVGDSNCPEVKIVQCKGYPASIVTIHWLLDSIDLKRPADEGKYMVTSNKIESAVDGMGSPLGKKGLDLLRSKNILTESDVHLVNLTTTSDGGEEGEECVMQKYTKQDKDTLQELLETAGSMFTPPEAIQLEESSRGDQTATQKKLKVFEGFQFSLAYFLNAQHDDYVREQIELGGGTVVGKQFKGIPDFLVTPNAIHCGVNRTATEIVSESWIIQSLQDKERQSFIYYHRPCTIKSDDALLGCVVTISGYTTYERQFLESVITAMGGVAQDQLARISKPELNVLGSTHLISSESSGKKYSAAIKWGKTVVNKDWLLECARIGDKAPVENYLVGSSMISENTSTVRDFTADSNRSLRNSPAPNTSATTPVLGKSNFDPAVTLVDRNPETYSQATPVNKVMERIKNSKIAMESPKTPIQKTRHWLHMDTPVTPLERCVTHKPSKELRKEIAHIINQFPDYHSPHRRLSTPLTELKRRCFNKLTDKYGDELSKDKADDEDREDKMIIDEVAGPSEISSQEKLFDKKLDEMNDLLTKTSESRRISKQFEPGAGCSSRESQPLTVQWDFMNVPTPEQRSHIFMLSGIDHDNRQQLIAKIESLGGLVSNLSSYDPAGSHLLSPTPARNEKTLSFMAAGKWILHPSYIDKSIQAKHFLNEEQFEFGNPKSKGNINSGRDNKERADAMHWWRKEIQRRGYGAFNDMRAIVVATKRDPIVRVIEAGGGVSVDVKPPYDDVVHATHCLLEPKYVDDLSRYVPLHKQGIYCVSTLYISDYLHRTCTNINDSILPYFR